MIRRLALGLCLLAASPLAAQDAFVRVQVIDVGQADGILVRTPNHRWVLIDGGKTKLLADSLVTRFRVDRFSFAVGSHRHLDHIGGLWRVLSGVPADLYVGDTTAYGLSAVDDSLRAVIRRRGIPVQAPDADTLDVDGVRFIVLPPGPRHADQEENENSLVVRLEFGQFSMLLTGDAEEGRRDWLVANHPALLDADVLKASHHGSRSGTSGSWLAAVTPRYVVISAGVDDGYQHPHREAVEAYIAATGGANRVTCTNRHQTVTVYGYADDRVRVVRRLPNDKSCVYDGTHY